MIQQSKWNEQLKQRVERKVDQRHQADDLSSEYEESEEEELK